MTRVKMLEAQGMYRGFIARGHSDYADMGEDIVCAAISAITQTAELGLGEVLGEKLSVERRDGEGFYRVEIAGEPTRDAQVIFKTMLVGLQSIEKGYPKFLKVAAH